MLVMVYECVIMQNKQLPTFICIVRSSLYDIKAGQQEGHLWFSSPDRPRPLLFKNCKQRFPPRAKRETPVSLYHNIDPKTCLS